jgi:hypothetical protein
MDLLKTPHEKLLEEAGALPQSPGMLRTPRQQLFQEAGLMPHLAAGGEAFGQNAAWKFGQNNAPEYPQDIVEVKRHYANGGNITPNDMRAELTVNSAQPQKFAADPYTHPELAKAWNNFFK